MAANFYDKSGFMVGVDVHEYHQLLPPPTGLEVPIWPYVVGIPFVWPLATVYKNTDTVQSDGWKMLQGGYDFYVVPHVPIPILPPHPLELKVLAGIHIGAGSKAQMQVHSVEGEGNSLATCLVSAFGLNVNCQGAGLSAPTGVVLNFNTVETSPSLGDYVGAISGMIVDALIGSLLNNALGKWAGERLAKKIAAEILKHILRRLGDVPYIKIAVDIPSHVQNFVQRFVDETKRTGDPTEGLKSAAEGFANDVQKAVQGD